MNKLRSWVSAAFVASHFVSAPARAALPGSIPAGAAKAAPAPISDGGASAEAGTKAGEEQPAGTCVERVPSGKERPTLNEKFPAV